MPNAKEVRKHREETGMGLVEASRDLQIEELKQRLFNGADTAVVRDALCWILNDLQARR